MQERKLSYHGLNDEGAGRIPPSRRSDDCGEDGPVRWGGGMGLVTC